MTKTNPKKTEGSCQPATVDVVVTKKVSENPECDNLVEAINATPPQSIHVEGQHYGAGAQALRARGFAESGPVPFNSNHGLHGKYFKNKELGLKAELSTGSFMGAFTLLGFYKL